MSLLIENNYVPVISSLAIGEEGEPLNVDGDRMASSLARATNAENLVLLTDVEKVIIDGKSVDTLSVHEAKMALKGIGPGMITKLYAAIEAIEDGVKKVVISSGFIEDPIDVALHGKVGTVIQR